jgi:CheY-like chemotaxis protein/HPt (histidine-containing phosphotransfer) domain-containing protein
MMMPEMDGEALGEAIKADPELAGSELVMMTSMGSRGDAGRLEALGFAAYLTKPVKQSQLFDCLMVVLSRRERRGHTPVTPRIITRHALADREKRQVRILLAEDNQINQRVALKTLEKLGYRADAVDNGADALHALAERRYDLVLMDVQMPQMDGIEATRRIRDEGSDVKDHRVPIVALTAHAMAEDREVCLAAGMNDYLSKPIRPDELAAALARWTVRRAEREPAVGLTGQLPADEVAPAVAAAAPVAGAGAGAGEPPVFDAAVLLNLLGGDRAAAAEITAEFLKDAPVRACALHDALDAGDAPRARREAHTLKGASANVGAQALREAAHAAELACAAEALTEAGPLAERVDAELERLRGVLAGKGGAG